MNLLFVFIFLANLWSINGATHGCALFPVNQYLAQTATAPQPEVMVKWKAGTEVNEQLVTAYGLANCFVQQPINNVVLARIKNKSYKTYCTVPLSDLRYLKVLHCNANGKPQLGELICHRSIANDLLSIFRKLYAANYPIERMVLIDNYGADDELAMAANNTSCFNCRYIAGTRKLSNHSSGRAIDINPLYNPYVWHDRQGKLHVSPATGRNYANRKAAFKYKIDTNDLCYREFIKHGFKWGGNWTRRKDYQHFER